MTYGSVVIVLGFIVMGAVVLSPMWSISDDAESHRRKSRLTGLTTVAAFTGLAMLYFLADRIDNPPPPEPPTPTTGSNIEGNMIIPAPRLSGTRATPKGVTIEQSGFGTVLTAPATEHEVGPFSTASPLPGLRPGDPAVAPEIAHLIRILPRVRPRAYSNSLIVSDLIIPPVVTGTVIMRDGCFRLAGKGEPLVLLPEYTRAVLDEAGYLILGPPGTARAMAGRVGETMWWYGPTLQVTNAAVTGPLRKACGPGRVVRVGTSSDAVSRNERDASTARSLSNMYGMSYDEARSQVATCQADADRRRAELRRRFGDDASKWPGSAAPGPCEPPPPPPVVKASDCPAGTTFSSGLCRNRKGFIVRVPPRPLF